MFTALYFLIIFSLLLFSISFALFSGKLYFPNLTEIYISFFFFIVQEFFFVVGCSSFQKRKIAIFLSCVMAVVPEFSGDIKSLFLFF